MLTTIPDSSDGTLTACECLMLGVATGRLAFFKRAEQLHDWTAVSVLRQLKDACDKSDFTSARALSVKAIELLQALRKRADAVVTGRNATPGLAPASVVFQQSIDEIMRVCDAHLSLLQPLAPSDVGPEMFVRAGSRTAPSLENSLKWFTHLVDNGTICGYTFAADKTRTNAFVEETLPGLDLHWGPIMRALPAPSKAVAFIHEAATVIVKALEEARFVTFADEHLASPSQTFPPVLDELEAGVSRSCVVAHVGTKFLKWAVRQEIALPPKLSQPDASDETLRALARLPVGSDLFPALLSAAGMLRAGRFNLGEGKEVRLSLIPLHMIRPPAPDAPAPAVGVFASVSCPEDFKPPPPKDVRAVAELGMHEGVVLEERTKPPNKWKCFWAFVVSIVAIVAGALLVALSAGSLTKMGFEVIAAGVTAFVATVTYCVRGGSFSVVALLKDMAWSLLKSLVSWGLQSIMRAIRSLKIFAKIAKKGAQLWAAIKKKWKFVAKAQEWVQKAMQKVSTFVSRVSATVVAGGAEAMAAITDVLGESVVRVIGAVGDSLYEKAKNKLLGEAAAKIAEACVGRFRGMIRDSIRSALLSVKTASNSFGAAMHRLIYVRSTLEKEESSILRRHFARVKGFMSDRAWNVTYMAGADAVRGAWKFVSHCVVAATQASTMCAAILADTGVRLRRAIEDAPAAPHSAGASDATLQTQFHAAVDEAADALTEAVLSDCRQTVAAAATQMLSRSAATWEGRKVPSGSADGQSSDRGFGATDERGMQRDINNEDARAQMVQQVRARAKASVAAAVDVRRHAATTLRDPTRLLAAALNRTRPSHAALAEMGVVPIDDASGMLCLRSIDDAGTIIIVLRGPPVREATVDGLIQRLQAENPRLTLSLELVGYAANADVAVTVARRRCLAATALNATTNVSSLPQDPRITILRDVHVTPFETQS